jgi:hypothetical protein
MWKTGYTGEVVNDKIFQNINIDRALDLAKSLVKPPTLHERIQFLRQRGQVLECHKQMRTSGSATQKRAGNKNRAKQKGQSAAPNTAQEPTGDSKSQEKEDKAVEIKGMS